MINTLLRLTAFALVVGVISLARIDTAMAVLSEQAASPTSAPEVPYQRDPSTDFEPIFRYTEDADDTSEFTSMIPEPSTLLLAAAGLGVQFFSMRRRR